MCMSPMIPTYRYSLSSPMPLDLNEDHSSHHLFNTNHQAASSSSSLSYSTIFNPDQDQGGGSNYYWEQKHEEAGKFIPSRGSWDQPEVEKGGNISDLELRVLKKEDRNNENLQVEDSSSLKWLSPKMRIIQRMMADQKDCEHKFDKQKLQLSPPAGTDDDNSCNNNISSNHSNITVRVCADCHTTKTPLWRSGPTGPKTLCNACGIRQRKARRALAATALANGSIHKAAEKPHVKGNKLQSKGKMSKTECASSQLKRKRKHGAGKVSLGRNKFSFEDLIISLSKNLAPQQVFPQDEKEAAILLMALSYDLLHGFPSDIVT